MGITYETAYSMILCENVTSTPSPQEWKFKVGDRVSRPVDVYGDHNIKKFGTVVRAFSEISHHCHWEDGDDHGCWYNPELYSVKWDNEVRVSNGYLPHGLDHMDA